MSSFDDLINKINRWGSDISKIDLKEVGEIVRDDITSRTISGKDLNSNNFKPLQPSTVREKKTLQKKGQLSKETSPEKSNLVRTGEMISDIKTIEKNNSNGKIVDVFLGSQESRKKAIDNAKLGRQFFGINETTENKVKEYIINRIIKIIKG